MRSISDTHLVHSHSFHANFVARLLRILLPSLRVLSTVHNVYEGVGRRMMAYRLTDFLSLRTTAVSAAAAQRFVEMKAVPAQKCMVVTNGIDTTQFAPDPNRRVQMRAGEACHAGEFIWLTAGRIVPAKDYPNMVRAFQMVRRERPNARLWIAGEAVGAEFERVRGMTAEMGESVRWLGLRRDFPALLDAADGFALGSAWEGMPLVVGEAMAMQKPVVATDVGGMRELLGETGTIVPAKSAEPLSEAMLEMMRRTDEERQALGRSARKRIVDNFSMEAKAGEWEALYGDLVGREK